MTGMSTHRITWLMNLVIRTGGSNIQAGNMGRFPTPTMRKTEIFHNSYSREGGEGVTEKDIRSSTEKTDTQTAVPEEKTTDEKDVEVKPGAC